MRKPKQQLLRFSKIILQDYLFIKGEDDVHERQLVLPKKHTHNVMKLGLQVIMAGYMGINKTIDRKLTNLY